MSNQSEFTSTPLFVDLDGTLIHSDLLVESLLELIKENILYVLLIPIWLLRGKAYLKYQIAIKTTIRVDLLPYNSKLLEFLKEEKNRGRKLVLISASNEKFVKAVTEHVGLFDGHFGSDEQTNLSGNVKLRKIQQSLSNSKFDYAGNAIVDLEIWNKAEHGIVVSDSNSLIEKAKLITDVSQTYPGNGGSFAGYFKSLRLHQWLKNLLLFLPLILSHQLNQSQLVIQSLIAFLSFGLCASSVYLLNDLLDLPNDRQHITKRMRPLAAGKVPLVGALFLSPLLLACAFFLASLVTTNFLLVLALYYCITSIYSFYLKKIVMIDVITLASLFTLRIIAGAAAIAVPLTFWLLAFSMFLFVSLAMLKRYTELYLLQEAGLEQPEGRGYYHKDLEILSILGCCSGFIAVLVFALYINDDNTSILYLTPQILWLICPLLLSLVSRVWMLAYRGEMDEDPIVFAIGDRYSQVVLTICGLMVWAATQSWDYGDFF